MPPFSMISNILFLLLLLLFSHLYLGRVEGLNPNSIGHVSEGNEKIIIKMRKLVAEVDALLPLDYDYGGPNPKHDPRRGKPPGSGGWKTP